MLIFILVSLIAIVSLFLDGKKGLALWVFVTPALAFQLAIGLIPDQIFHLVACALDLLVLHILVTKIRRSSMTTFLSIISAFAIMVNIYGWMAYDKGHQALVYDWTFTAIYAAVLLWSLWEWWSCARANRGCRNHTGLRGNSIYRS